MRRILALALLTGIVLSACEKENKKGNYTGELSGTFKGTFQRISLGGITGGVAKVTLNFTGNNFSGESDRPYYPAICKGSFSVQADTVSFTNACVWPAHFDWSLILQGNYQVRQQGDSIEITRDNAAACYQDVYRLAKQD